MEDNKGDDFTCMRVSGGKTVTTYKGVTVVASKYKDELENRSKESVTAKSWWHRLIRQLRFICKER